MAQDVSTELSDEQLLRGLSRLRKEREWVSVKAIIELSGAGQEDGRPEVEAAWAMCPKNEETSIVWTEEMAEAFGLCRPLLNDGNEIGARMVFKEQYPQIVSRARVEHKPVRWIPSLGWDANDRLRALSEAIEKKRITEAHAFSMLGFTQREELLAQLPAASRKMLIGESGPVDTKFLNGLQKTVLALTESKLMPAPEPVPERTEPSILDDPEKKQARIKLLKEQLASRMKPKVAKRASKKKA
jgi:hypothetical protein